MNKLIPLLAFSILLLVPGTHSIFADTMIIGPGASVTVESGSTMTVDSADSPNTLTNQGTLTVEDGGNVVITKEGDFFNGCFGITNLNTGGTMQIGSLGALFATLTNHGSVFGPGQINFIADSIQVKNSDILTAILNPSVAILEIISICGGGGAVGGTFIPIDSTALLLSSAQTSMIWWLPAVLIIGASIILLKSQRSVKVNA